VPRSLIALKPGASPRRAQITRDAKDPRWITGTISVSAPADQVQARVACIAEWPNLLSDIETLRVIERSGKRWHVKIETRTMKCGAHDYIIDVAGDGSVELVIDATGINANGRIAFKALRAKANRSRASTSWSRLQA
jgi:hypothetical protein